MKKTMGALFVTAALASVAFPASAQVRNNEISLFGSWEDVREPANVEQSHLFFRYGRFVRPQLVGTVGVQRSRFESGSTDVATTALTVGAKYYISPLRAQALVPFVDASVGVAVTDTGPTDSSDFTWEFGGGVSFFFTESTSFDAGLRLFHTSTDVDTKGTRLFVGITTRF